MKPFFISIPHAGEQVPKEVYWLQNLPETVLMCDVDRYVDQLYIPGAEKIGLPAIATPWHRYVVDCNRVPEDVDQNSVEDVATGPGAFTTGYHWSKTTTGAMLMKEPISRSLHNALTEKYFLPFHAQIKDKRQELKTQFGKVYHLDAHSMPSRGTDAHRDPGETRAQIVVSDQDGKSCDPSFRDLVVRAYESAGFQVVCNWPYKGGRITETYGVPALGFHTLQVEMSRVLYMDEATKQKKPDEFLLVQKSVQHALTRIWESL